MFPSVCPSERELTPGAPPSKQFRMQNGMVRSRVYGSVPVDARINLTFRTASAAAAQVMAFWRQVEGIHQTFEIPTAKLLEGEDQTMIDEFTRYSQWAFEGPPQNTSVPPGRSSLTVTLVSRFSS
jgi:hypothetical protein